MLDDRRDAVVVEAFVGAKLHTGELSDVGPGIADVDRDNVQLAHLDISVAQMG